jgi:ADP-heptose:LPS heptosyltransferase
MTYRPTALVLRALGLGDFLTGLPALAMLRTVLPQHRIVLALPDALAPLALLAGTVDATVPGHELSPLVHAPEGPELAIDLHGNGPQSRRLLVEHAPARLIAYGLDGLVWCTSEHEVARWARLVREGFGAPDLPVPPVSGSLPIPPIDEAVPAGRTIVHCGAKSESRRWPTDRFAAVAAELKHRGHHVLITAGPGEYELSARIAAMSGTAAAPAMDLPHLLALIAASRLVISGDTGVAHAASTYAVPSVVLFGPVSPAIWGPPPIPRHQVLWHGDGTGDPHGASIDPSLLRITVAEVLAAAGRADMSRAG